MTPALHEHHLISLVIIDQTKVQPRDGIGDSIMDAFDKTKWVLFNMKEQNALQLNINLISLFQTISIQIPTFLYQQQTYTAWNPLQLVHLSYMFQYQKLFHYVTTQAKNVRW